MIDSSAPVVCERSDAKVLPPQTAAARHKKSLGRLGFGKVLIVDDNDIEQLRAAMLSNDLGATVEVVSSGRLALSILEASDDVWLVLMDCDMPEMSGLEAARQWRQIERGWRSAIPIVGLSRNADKDYARCIAAGMNDCLSKPLRREDIARCFARWMQPSSSVPKRVVQTLSYDG